MERSETYLEAMRTADNAALPFDHDREYTMTGIRQIPYYRSPAEDAEAMVGDPTAAAGCICSCASDMEKWLRFNLNRGRVGTCSSCART